MVPLGGQSLSEQVSKFPTEPPETVTRFPSVLECWHFLDPRTSVQAPPISYLIKNISY